MNLKRVLSVDDSEADQYLTRYRIEQHDSSIEVRSVYDGEEALEALREGDYQPDLILLDINMPRMGGFEFLDHYVEEFGAEGAPPVIVFTSSRHGRDSERAKSYALVRGYLLKPLQKTWPDDVGAILGEG